MFNDALHTMTLSEDGSYTAYSKEYDEHYHSTKDGALNESLLKHVCPAFALMQGKEPICILDICYGLGFNTLATLYHHRQNAMTNKLFIYSPELDGALVKSLQNFTYPKEFEAFREIVIQLSQEGVYEDEFFYIEVFIGDARAYVRGFEGVFDIVYQDAFSPKANPLLWTQEYFADIQKAMKPRGILTTYSIALPTRLALYENGFHIYLNSGEGYRNATIASPAKIEGFEIVDMEHKIACNPDAKSLRD
ncbi:MAG: MnmC family methyltransferase [Sulfurimonas sp.]|nr:MnmC family methyltransferase [Sulfurimonas sp.]MDD3059846.1 MnmC family methyltransferase [Sulfurimonas sp.]MDD5202416.1 MnmC family methyltransferase [Sulfurimonas sp.]